MVFPCLPERCFRSIENRSGSRSTLWFGAAVLLCLFALAPANANLPYDPRISLEKSVDDLRDNGDGSFTVEFRLVATNSGNETLRNVTISDALEFVEASRIVDVSPVELVSGELTPNAGYDGVGDISLLSGTDTLPAGAAATLRFELRFLPEGNPGPYTNVAVTRAMGKYSEREVTAHAERQFSLPLGPKVEFQKTVTDVVNNGDGTFSAVVTLDAVNVGAESLLDLQLKDDLDIFGSGALIDVSDIVVLDGSLTLNPDYDGISDIRLLAGENNLHREERVRLRFSIMFDPALEQGPFENCALFRSRGKHSETAVDARDCDVIEVPPVPEVKFTKTIGSVTSNADGTLSAVVMLDAINIGNDDLVRLQLKDDLDIFGNGALLDVSGIEVIDGSLTLNPDYDGISDVRLLAGENNLPQGERARLKFSVTFDPEQAPGPFENCAVFWSLGQRSEVELDVQDCDEIRIPPLPMIELDKETGPVSGDADGSLVVPVTLTVINTGNEILETLQIVDSLDIFGAGRLVAVEAVDSPTLNPNPNYDGLADTDILAGSDVLAPGEQAVVTFIVRFDPGPETGPFVNVATASATGGTSGDPVSDNDDASFLAMPTEPNPAIRVDKRAGDVVDNGDGTFSVSMLITATNIGDEALANLQINDPLDIFGNGQLIAVENLASTTLNVNPAYDGLTETALLTGTDRLLQATAGSVNFTLRFDPGSESGPFTNVATASADGEISGEPVTDSDDAAFLATPPQPNPAVDVNKVAGGVSTGSNGTFTVPITITITNVGNEALANVQLTDSLDIFGGGQLVAVENISGTGLSVNAGYNGLSDINLLSGNDSLALANAGTITFDIRFDPGQEPGPFINIADAAAIGVITGDPVSDNDDASFLAMPTEPNPAIRVDKQAGDVVDNGDGTFSVSMSITATNIGDEALANLQLDDPLDIFGNGQVVAVENLASSTLSINPAYDGLTETALLTGTDRLLQATAGSVNFTLRFDPGPETGPFTNVGSASASGEISGDPVSDSDDTSFLAMPAVPNPAIDVTKVAGDVSAGPNGTFTVPITITITNIGNEALANVQVTDSLDIFGGGQLVAVENLAGAGLSINPGYDGLSDANLLSGNDNLALASAGTITFLVRFDPGPEPGPFINVATSSAIGVTTGDPASDSDDASFLAMPAEPNPAIRVDKRAGDVVDNGDGTFSVSMSITATNIGDEALANLQLDDPLDIFGNGQVVAVENLASSTLSINPAYDGLTETALLTGTDRLPLATAGSVDFTLRFDPGPESGPFTNIVSAGADGEISGDPVYDTDDASFLAMPAEPNPAISIEKLAGSVVDNGDSTFTVPMTITVTNTGNDVLLDLQLADSLDIFGAGQLIAVENLASPTLAVNPNYDGLSDSNLLTGTDSLPLAGAGTVTFSVRFEPAAEPGPFINIVYATALGESTGTSVVDSDDAPFLATATQPNPAIDVEKSVGDVINNGDGTFDVAVNVTVTNVGNEALGNLQLEDSLDIFGSGMLTNVQDLASDTLTINSNYDGLGDTNILAGTDRLPMATSATVTFVMRFDPASEPGPFTNTVTATAIGEVTDVPVTDESDAVFELPDPPGPVADAIMVIKSADRRQVMRGENVAYEIAITNLTENSIADVIITDHPPFGFRFVEESGVLIRAGHDEILYTPDDIVTPIATSGSRPVVFESFNLGPLERVAVRYLMSVSVGVADGEYINSVTVMPDPFSPVSSSTPVTVFGDPIFEQTTLIGKVFDDHNDNGIQDKEEPGVPGVRLATVAGLTVETDSEGRYHLADVSVDRFDRGSNFIIKLDEASLPPQTAVLGDNPRVIRLTQATMTKVNFPVKLSRSDAYPTDPEQCDNANSNRLGSTSVDGSSPDCDDGEIVESSSSTAMRITVSGGTFGCNQLAADTLPGRLSGRHSEVIVYGDAVALSSESLDDPVCKPAANGEPAIRVGEYPLELTTRNNTRLRISRAGDVVRMEDPDNDEHIIVTPFRDDSASTAVTALRVINDGVSPGDNVTNNNNAAVESRGPIKGHVDQLVVDPRLDVLAMNGAIIGTDGKLADPIAFAIYTNYPAFIKGYRLEVFGRVANRPRRELLHIDEFTQYRFDLRRMFDGAGLDLSRYDELEYQLKASDCPFSLRDKSCLIDMTVARTLALGDESAGSYAHLDNELWGQTSLVDQRIPISGGRVRLSGKVEPGTVSVQRNNRYVPVATDGTYVLEEHLPSEDIRRRDTAEIIGQPPTFVSADASNIQVSGGLFGCGRVAIGELPGRQKNKQSTIRAATITADSTSLAGPPTACPRPESSPCKTAVKPGEIEIVTDEGSCFIVSATGDVIPDALPTPDINRQQLVITPFRDETDSSKLTALRIANEGTPGEVPANPVNTEVILTGPAEDYWFTVAMANLTVGQNNLSGNKDLLSADAHFDGSTYTDGRIAFFTKGRIDEKYRVTAQLDTTEDELQNFTDNLKRKDPRRIFRQLDPNRYFPTYGDDSITTTDVDSQGAFYARVDWDKSTALWGNFNTGLTDTEFMQYNRSLYGLKLKHESLEATDFSNSKSKLTLFGSEAQSAAAHVTFRATGGSLYYLRDTDIVQGSEKVWIEVRRRDTEQVVERTILLEGRDYEIDPIQGRIILRRPLSQVVNDRERSIIRSSPLEGDEVFLLVDYEYVPLAFAADKLTYGGRGQAWIGDHVAIGATSVSDERDNTDYSLQGVDLTLQYSETSYLRAEFAESRARQNNANFLSADGGLSFNSQVGAGLDDSLDGDALALEARIDFADFNDALNGDLRAWSKSRDAEFSTGRLGQGLDVNDRGIELHADIGDQIELTATYTDLELETASRQQVTRVQLDGNIGELEVGVEVRHEDIALQNATTTTSAPTSAWNGTTSEGEALLVGARAGFALNATTSVYAAGQTVADDKGNYRENDLFTLGINTQLREDLGLSLEASDGDRGSAMIAGVDYAMSSGLNFKLSGGVGSGAINQFATRYEIGEGHELYGSYAIDPDRTDNSRNLLTLGQRRSFGNGIGLFTESQFGKDDRYASIGHVFGLDFEGNDDWRFNASLQRSENEGLGLAFDRSALSLGAYRNAGDLKLSSRLEYREDEGNNVHNRQYVSTSSFNKIVNMDRRWLGQLNISWTDDLINGGHDARFVELDVGHAVRPADNDKFNLIARYSFLYDLPTEGQNTIRPDERSHLLSLEGIYDFDNRWELAAKAAIRKGERRSMRDMGPWQDFGLRMASIRARYQVSKSWDGVAEYRWLSDIDGDNERQGALLTLYRQIGGNLKIGVGFNFAGFNDKLRVDDYDNRGWFVDLIGMY